MIRALYLDSEIVRLEKRLGDFYACIRESSFVGDPWTEEMRQVEKIFQEYKKERVSLSERT